MQIKAIISQQFNNLSYCEILFLQFHYKNLQKFKLNGKKKPIVQSGSAYNFISSIVLSLLLNFCSTSNLITNNVVLNGNFQLPILPGPSSYFYNTAKSWTGANFELQNNKLNDDNIVILFNQYIDLQSIPYHNGFIQQIVQVKNKGICNLSYYYTCQSNDYNSYIMEVYWNGNKVWTQQSNSLAVMMNQLTVQANIGINVLQLVQVGDDSDWSGLFIDQVALNCGPFNNNESSSQQSQLQQNQFEQNQLQLNSLIQIVLLGLFVPVPQCTPLRPLYLFTNDIWIYNYDIVDYQNTTCLENILNTLNLVSDIQIKFLNKYTKLQKIRNKIGIGNKYINFTNEKFLKVEQTSSILIDSCFFYFLYTCPIIIFTSILLYFGFCCIRKFRISQFLKKFYFVKTIIVLSLFQCNITYFVYVCLSHFNNSFSFSSIDKLYLTLTVLYFFLLTIFAISFYYLVSAYLKKYSTHFLHSLKRSHQSLNFLTLKDFIRRYLLGCIHFYFYTKYQIMLTLLCCVQCTIIMIIIFYQKKKKIFLIKIKFVIQMLYQFSFLLLNLILCGIFMIMTNKQGQVPLQTLNTIKQLMYQFEQMILHLQVFLLLAHIVVDCLPKRFFQPSRKIGMNETQITQLKLKKSEDTNIKQPQTLDSKKKRKKLKIHCQIEHTQTSQKDLQAQIQKLEANKKYINILQKIMKTKYERVKKQKLQIKFISYMSNVQNVQIKRIQAQKQKYQINKQNTKKRARKYKKDEYK